MLLGERWLLPVSDLIDRKLRSIRVLERILLSYSVDLGESMLEIGGGSGWASCLIKSRHPQMRIVLTDICEQTLAQVRSWISHFGAGPDEVLAVDAKNLSFTDSSFNSVLVFAGLHHMKQREPVLRQVHRVLRPGGTFFVLYEPSYPLFWLEKKNGRYAACKEEDGYLSPQRYVQILKRAGFVPQIYEYGLGRRCGVWNNLVKCLKTSTRPCSLVIIARKP